MRSARSNAGGRQIGGGCTFPTLTSTTAGSRVTYASPPTRSEGSRCSRRSAWRSARPCDTGTATTSTPLSAEFTAFAARTGVGQDLVSMIETARRAPRRPARRRRTAGLRRAVEAPSRLGARREHCGTDRHRVELAWPRRRPPQRVGSASLPTAGLLRTFVELWEISVRARRGERDPRFDRFAADDFESLPWDQFRLAALACAGTAAAALARRAVGGGARGDPRALPRTALDPAVQLRCVRRRRRPTRASC